MKKMIYEKAGKKIIFDDFCDNRKEYGSFWVEMCQSCFEKYRTILAGREDGGSACGTCSVEGCSNEADYYIDFAEDEVSFADAADDFVQTNGTMVLSESEYIIWKCESMEQIREQNPSWNDAQVRTYLAKVEKLLREKGALITDAKPRIVASK